MEKGVHTDLYAVITVYDTQNYLVKGDDFFFFNTAKLLWSSI